jgi:uncharacterized protein
LIKKLIYIPISVGLIIAVESISQFSFLMTNHLYPTLRFLDKGNAFLYITIHHLFQGLIAFSLIFLISCLHDKNLADFGLNLNQWKYAIKRVYQFALIWTVIQLSVGFSMISGGSIGNFFNFELTVKNYTGYFLFQILLSGSSEELLYRAFLIGTLIIVGKQIGLSHKLNITLAVTASMLAFVIGHVSYTIFPFTISSYNVLQLLTVLIFGSFYTYLFIKTKSVLGPIIAHNVLNGIIVLSSLILTFAMKK